MDKKDIQDFSLAKLIDTCGLRPEDCYYDGCLIATRTCKADEAEFDLFRFPTRVNALALAFCPKGSITLTCGLTRHRLGKQMLFVYRPGSIVQMESAEEEAAVQLLVCEEELLNKADIDLKQLSQLILRVEKYPCMALGDDEWNGIQHSLDELTYEIPSARTDDCSVEIVRSLLRVLAYRVCRIVGRQIEAHSQPVYTARSRNEEYFQEFLNILRQHYTQQRSVGFYAERMHLTPKYLTTLIRKTSGRTAVQWIDAYVVLEAKSLLKYSTMSIQEIAYYLNFPNQSFFGKYFKNHTGLTPSAYRMSK